MQTELSEPAVLNWDSVIHKGVRTKDGKPLGYIAAEDEECIYFLSSRFRQYRIKGIDSAEEYFISRN